jgi:crossover junction endodeoxyribonuclease RuvC
LHKVEDEHVGFFTAVFRVAKVRSLGFAFLCYGSMGGIVRILAIDPSLRSTGYAVLEKVNGKLHAIEYGSIRNAASLLPSGCLVQIRKKIEELISSHTPSCAVFEGIIFVQSHRTAITLGAARGAALVAAAEKDLPIYEYAPRRVKQSVVGRGTAQKEQVAFMVRALLGLTETPQADAADALAIGLTHFQTAQSAGAGVATLIRI